MESAASTLTRNLIDCFNKLEAIEDPNSLPQDFRFILGQNYFDIAQSLARGALQNEETRRIIMEALVRCITVQPDRNDILAVAARLQLGVLVAHAGQDEQAVALAESATAIFSGFARSEQKKHMPLMSTTIRLCQEQLEFRKYLIKYFLSIARVLQYCATYDDCSTFDAPCELLKEALSFFEPDSTDLDVIETHYERAIMLHLSARHAEAIAEIRTAQAKQAMLIKKHPLGALGIRFFQTRSANIQGFGHLGSEPDVYAKMGMLRWREPIKAILLAPLDKVVNRALLAYVQRYLCVVTDARLRKRFEPIKRVLEYNSFWTPLPKYNNHLNHFAANIIAVQREWEEQHRKPLFTLMHRHREDGWKLLRERGVPEGAWFVSIHARDQALGKNGEPVNALPTAHRDCDIETYGAAIEAIIKRGGWVCRIADPSMRPCTPRQGFIDFAGWQEKPQWLDIFLAAECRFFLGTSSGPSGLPTLFGVPAILTNGSPFNCFSPSTLDLYLPKLLRRRSTGELIHFREALAPPYYMAVNTSAYARNDAEVVNNTPEELREITIEMLDRLEGKICYDAEDDRRQKCFEELALEHSPFGVPSRVGREFLRRYERLLE